MVFLDFRPDTIRYKAQCFFFAEILKTIIANELNRLRKTLCWYKKPPLLTILKVAGLANPLCLVEIDAVAVVEDKEMC